MLFLPVCAALFAVASKGENISLPLGESSVHGSSLSKNVKRTLGVCATIIQEVRDFHGKYLTPDDVRRLTAEEEIDNKDLVKGVKKKFGICVDIIDAVDVFRKEYAGIRGTEEKREFSDPIVLNVGGKLFTTSLSTLRSKKDTLFAKMFSEGANTNISADGTFFIDRDPTFFGYVLDFLRSGDLLIKSSDETTREQLLQDVKYFKLPAGLIEYLRWSPFKGIDLWFSEFSFLNSQLKSVSGTKLGGVLYQASKDGQSVSTFHSYCNGKGPTVVIVETSIGNLFGGYAATSWSNSGGYTTSPGSFLFQLRPSMKRYNQNNKNSKNAIYSSSSYGPTFGNGHDLYITACMQSSTCYARRTNYDLPSAYELNDGEMYFRMKDYAVVLAKKI